MQIWLNAGVESNFAILRSTVMADRDYRARIYGRYVEARGGAPLVRDAASLAPREAYLARMIRRHFPAERETRILDLGCGHGAILAAAAQAGYRNLAGIDASPVQVAMARELGIAGVRQGDLATELAALPAESEDVVIAFDVLEHFAKDETVAFVDGVLRALRPGGRWIIHVPNGESPFGGRVRYGDFTHEQAFTRNSLAQLLLASGFARVECHEDAPAPHGLRSAVRWGLWKLIRLGLRVWLAAETGDAGRDAIFSQNLLAIAFKPGPGH